METGFAVPSCNYNIKLSDEDLKQLLEKGYVTMRPIATKGMFIDEHGNSSEVSGTSLTYGEDDDYPVQFVCVCLDKK